MTKRTADSPAGWAIAAAQLPERLDGWRVLEVGGDRGEELFGARGAAEFVSCAQPSENPGFEGPFDLVHCSSRLATDLHPLSLFAWAWKHTAAGSVLLAGSEILADPAQSQFARYVPAAESANGIAHWIPGRLALRWMTEVSGFDAGWLGERPTGRSVEGYVKAVRTERAPALDLFRQPLGR